MSWKFFKVALRDWRVGAVTETSQHATVRVLSFLKPEYNYVVEYGAGRGAVTKKLLERLPANGRVIAIETNGEFYRELNAIKDPRLVVMQGSVAELAGKLRSLGLPRIDMVISSVPFTFFSAEKRRKIIQDTFHALADHGRLVVFHQYSTLVKRLIKSVFGNARVSLELRNFPPHFVMVGEKH